MKLGELAVGPVIPVSDLERSRRFYEDRLGLTGEPAPGGYKLNAGGGTVAYLLESTDYPGSAQWPLASFATDDLDAVVDFLHASGVALEQITEGSSRTDDRGIATLPGMRIAWICDPDRQVLSIFELDGEGETP